MQASKTHRQDEQQQVIQTLRHMAEEQVVFLKNRYNMMPHDIITLYGGKPLGNETYGDAVERIAVFNYENAERNGFVA